MPGWHRGERRPRSRLAGCLLWIFALFVLLIILSLLFGGFRKGTKAGMGPPRPVVTSQVQLGRD
jgi:hypothetical protein